MVCQSCKNTVADDTLICPHCDNRIAKTLQTKKIEKMKEEDVKTIARLFRSAPFILLSVFMTLLTLLYVICILIGFMAIQNIVVKIVALVNYIGALFPLSITCICCWKLIVNNKKNIILGGFKSFSVFLKIFYKILFFAFILGGIVLFIAAIADMFGSSSFLYSHSGTPMLSLGQQEGIFFLLVASGLLVGILILFKKIYKTYDKINVYYGQLKLAHTTKEFKINARAPRASLYVIATIFINLGILEIFLYVIATIFINSEIQEIFLINLPLGILSFIKAFHLIFTAIFFTYTEELEKKRQTEYEAERAKLSDIEKKTLQTLAEIKRQKQKAELEQRKKAEEAEREREEIRKRLRQQQMMKEMMKEMLAEEAAAPNKNS